MRAVLGSILFFIVAPGTVAGLIPWLVSHWRFQPTPPGFAFVHVVGVALIVAGLIPLIESFVRFAWAGLGTPAPVAPTEHLVATGFYRFVRNPMYVGVVTIILGEAALFADVRLLWCAAIVWLSCHLFVLLYEEPTLTSSFGDDYARFRANVPRWLPRLTPWRG